MPYLGNTRMVLTEEQQTDQYPAATMELANNATEVQYYSKIPETRVAKPAGYTGDANTLAYVAKTNGSGNKIGPGITLKVMAGDQFSIKVNSWYKTNGVVLQNPVDPLADLLSALTNGVGNLPGSKSTPTQLQQAAVFTPGATSFLNSQPAPGTKPKAYLNWVLFDEQFKLVQVSSGAELVGADNSFTNHVKTNLPINKNGYLYIYLSNATPNIDVFFDNLQVTHNRGALLEESHYYPGGLVQQGISYKSAGKLQNKKLYQQYELNSDFDLNLYESFYRSHDPQLGGRFWQIDPKPDFNVSPYAAMGNNPILNSDPLGDTLAPILRGIGSGAWNLVKGVVTGVVTALEPIEKPEPGSVDIAAAFGLMTKDQAKQEIAAMNSKGQEGLAEAITETALSIGLSAGVLDKIGGKTGKASKVEANVAKVGELEAELSSLKPTHYLTRSKAQMQNLVNDIRDNGIKEPLQYVEVNGNKYIVGGNHRYFAAQKLGIKKVPVEQVKLPFAGYKATIDLMMEGKMPGYWKFIK